MSGRNIVSRLRDVSGFIQKEHGRVEAAASLATEAADEIERLRSALRLMVSTYPYSPPCHNWEPQVEAHKAAKAALANS